MSDPVGMSVSPQPPRGGSPSRRAGCSDPPAAHPPGCCGSSGATSGSASQDPPLVPAGPTKPGHREPNQLLTKEESLSPTNKKSVYLSLIPRPSCRVLLWQRGETSPLPSPLPARIVPLHPLLLLSMGWINLGGGHGTGKAGCWCSYSRDVSVRWFFPPEHHFCPSKA